MRYARTAWSALCVIALVAAFVRLRGWDTGLSAHDTLSGTETFAAGVLVLGVGWLVGRSILAVLDDSLAAHGQATASWLLGLLAKAAIVLGLGFAGLLVGGWFGDAMCTKSGEPGDVLYGFECMDDALTGAVLGAFIGLTAGVVVLVLAPWRRRRR